jgi:hypothetical protein
METMKIIFLCILSAVLYGVLHDQVTARVCIEYFTIGHAPTFATHSPTLLGIGWGILATWWFGLFFGVVAALASQLGSWPKLRAVGLLRPVCGLILVTALASLLAGITGYFLARVGRVWLVEPFASKVPVSKHALFLADFWAHAATYGVGFLGGIAICGWVVLRRRQMARCQEACTMGLFNYSAR